MKAQRKSPSVFSALAGIQRRAVAGWALLIGIALVAAVASWTATDRYGVALSPDSVAYVSVARSLLGGQGLTTYRDQPLVQWPPLYPVLLAGGSMLTGLEPLVMARCLNVIILGALVVLGGGMTACFQAAGWQATVAMALLVVLAGPLFGLASWALSEPLFALEVLAALAFLHGYRRGGGWPCLIGGAVIVLAACFTRYLGLSLIVAGGLGVLTARHHMTWRSRVWAAAVFGVVTTVPVAAWLARNLALTGHAFGRRGSSPRAFTYNLELVVQTVGSWWLPVSAGAPRWLLLLVPCVAAIVLVALAWRLRREPSTPWAAFELPGLFVAVYVGLLVWSASTSNIDPIDDRLLSPVYVPLLLLVVGLLAASGRALSLHRLQRRWRLAGLVACGLLAIGLARGRAAEIAEMRRDGAGGYNHDRWRNNPVLGDVSDRLARDRGPVFSNRPDLLYILLHRPSHLLPPRQDVLKLDTDAAGAHALLAGWPQLDGAMLIWFNDAPRRGVCTIEDLAERLTVVPLTVLPEGGVYRVQPRPPVAHPLLSPAAGGGEISL